MSVPYGAGEPSSTVVGLLPVDAGIVLDAGVTWSDTGDGELVVTTRGLLAIDPESGDMAGIAWEYFDPPSQLTDLGTHASLEIYVEGAGYISLGIDRKLAGNIWSIAYQMRALEDPALIEGLNTRDTLGSTTTVRAETAAVPRDAGATGDGREFPVGPEAEATPEPEVDPTEVAADDAPPTISIAAALAATTAERQAAADSGVWGWSRSRWRRRLWFGMGAAAFVTVAAAGSVTFGQPDGAANPGGTVGSGATVGGRIGSSPLPTETTTRPSGATSGAGGGSAADAGSRNRARAGSGALQGHGPPSTSATVPSGSGDGASFGAGSAGG